MKLFKNFPQPMQKRILIILMSLMIEFLLGMFINLFGVTPEEAKTSSHPEPLLSRITFILHSLNGLILLIASFETLFFSIKSHISSWNRHASYGTASIVLAFSAGIATVILQDQASEISSYIMSLGFLLSFIFYGKFLYSLR